MRPRACADHMPGVSRCLSDRCSHANTPRGAGHPIGRESKNESYAPPQEASKPDSSSLGADPRTILQPAAAPGRERSGPPRGLEQSYKHGENVKTLFFVATGLSCGIRVTLVRRALGAQLTCSRRTAAPLACSWCIGCVLSACSQCSVSLRALAQSWNSIRLVHSPGKATLYQ